MSQPPISSTWRTKRINIHQQYYWVIGEISLWVKCDENTIRLAYAYRSGLEWESPENPPKNLLWHSWPVYHPDQQIRITPIFPDRPVVVKPEVSFRLYPHSSLQSFVRIPIWLQITSVGKKENILITLPSVVLSHTWFGKTTEGELCYWISSGMRHQTEPDPSRIHSAICSIKVVNESDDDLNVEKICLHTESLSMFYDSVQLWSDDIAVSYRGTQDATHIQSSGTPPKESPVAKRISTPRKPQKKGFTAKTFSSIMDLPGLGFTSITG